MATPAKRRPRDSQVTKVKNAEHEFIQATPELAGRAADALIAWVANVTGSRAWRDRAHAAAGGNVARWNRVRRMLDTGISVSVNPKRGRCDVFERPHAVVLEVPDTHVVHVAHVLAHNLVPDGQAPHGAEFVKQMLWIMDMLVGADDRKKFKKILLNHKIKTKVVSAETREKYREAYNRRQVQAMPKMAENLQNILSELEGM